MALRFRQSKELSRFLFRFLSPGDLYKKPGRMFSVPFLNNLIFARDSKEGVGQKVPHTRWCSTALEREHGNCSSRNFFAFIESVLAEPEGPCHCWLNKIEERGKSFSIDGIFLVIAGDFLDDSIIFNRDRVLIFERVKLLQQRYPMLNVFGFQVSSSFNSVAGKMHVVRTAFKEFITFPILLSSKDFNEVNCGPCYILVQGLHGPLLYFEKDLDLGKIIKAIGEVTILKNANPKKVQNSNSTWSRVPDFTKEPFVCNSLRNLILFFPGSISVDEAGNRLFISDTNHHRIIVADGNGKLLDCIGSLPGFEDGEFEAAKLLRPAASFYDASQNSLFFVDSENHAVRKANMETRVLETVYPISNSHKGVWSLWGWILDKLWLGKNVDLEVEPKEFNMNSFSFPWHLLKFEDNDLFITNRSFETLWVLSTITWEIKQVISGFPCVMEVCGQMISEKISVYERFLVNRLEQNICTKASLEKLPYADLVSSCATFQNSIFFCDPDGQSILKCTKGSNDVSNLRFSNFGMLGLPYWFTSPVERTFLSGDIHGRPRNEHIQYFNLLPGRCDIHVNVELPLHTKLAEALQEGSIWRQARGSAVEVLGSESVAQSSKKVGVAQQLYDDLDSVIFAEPELESAAEEAKLESAAEEDILDESCQENKVHFDCAVNISPGSSEVVIYAVIYLKLKEIHDSAEQNMRTVMKMLDIHDDEKSRRQGGEACAQFLLQSCRDLREAIFLKPLHLKIRLHVDDYPVPNKGSENPRGVLLPTDSLINVNVSLD